MRSRSGVSVARDAGTSSWLASSRSFRQRAMALLSPADVHSGIARWWGRIAPPAKALSSATRNLSPATPVHIRYGRYGRVPREWKSAVYGLPSIDSQSGDGR